MLSIPFVIPLLRESPYSRNRHLLAGHALNQHEATALDQSGQLKDVISVHDIRFPALIRASGFEFDGEDASHQVFCANRVQDAFGFHGNTILNVWRIFQPFGLGY